jgi:uncharacterized protein (DUF1501 family)
MTTPLNRRHFMARSVHAGAGLSALGMLGAMTAAAQSDDYKALVCLFMFGGNDSNNLVVPLDAASHAVYAASRTSVLALPQNSLLPITLAGTAAGRQYGLHPAMAGMQGLVNTGKASVIANIGTLVAPTTKAQYDTGAARPPNLFSHSDQQQAWQTGTPDGTQRTGWAGRLTEMQAASNGVNALYGGVSVAGNSTFLNGNQTQAYKVSPSGNFGFDFYNPANTSDPVSAGVAELLATSRGHVMEQTWTQTIERSIENQRVLQSALSAPAAGITFPDSSLGRQLQMITRLIVARDRLGLKRQAFFASIGGFDTHGDDQLQRQNQLLGEISAAVTAFSTATTTLGIADKVTLFTASDFSRNLKSNGQGSDHAWGAHQLVVGGAVRGGQMFGQFPNLALNGPDDVGNGTFLPTTSVDQLGASVAQWFGVSATNLDTLFPLAGRFASKTLPIFRS